MERPRRDVAARGEDVRRHRGERLRGGVRRGAERLRETEEGLEAGARALAAVLRGGACACAHLCVRGIRFVICPPSYPGRDGGKNCSHAVSLWRTQTHPRIDRARLHNIHVEEELEARGAHGDDGRERLERVRDDVEDALEEAAGGGDVGGAVGELELAEEGGAVAEAVAAGGPLGLLRRVAEEGEGEEAEGAEGEGAVGGGGVVGRLGPVEEVEVRVVPAAALRRLGRALCAGARGRGTEGRGGGDGQVTCGKRDSLPREERG